MIQNDSRLKAIESEFNKFDDIQEKENKVEYLRMLNEIEQKMFAELGYPAIVFLPVKTLIAENLGIVGDAMEKQKQLEGQMESGEMFDGAMLKTIGSNSVMFTMFGGYQIAQTIHVIKSKIANAGESVLGIFGGFGAKISSFFSQYTSESNSLDLFDIAAASMFLQVSFDTVVITVIVAGATLVFSLLFIEKLFAFISLMFLVFYTFHKNQEEKVISSIVKIFAVAFKTVLVTTCIILAVFSLSLVDKFEIIMLNEFFNSMDMIENKTWEHISMDGLNILSLFGLFIKKYVFYSVAKVSFMITKIFLMVKMIFSMPAYLYELIYERTNSVTDGIAENIVDATRQQTVRV